MRNANNEICICAKKTIVIVVVTIVFATMVVVVIVVVAFLLLLLNVKFYLHCFSKFYAVYLVKLN